MAPKKVSTLKLNEALKRIEKKDKNQLNEGDMVILKWSKNVDRGYAWIVLFSLFYAMCTTLGPYRIYSLIFARTTSEGAYTREEASWPVSMIYTVDNLVGPVVSIIVYHISYRQTYLIGSILLILGNGLATLSSSLWIDTLLIGVVQGVGFSFIFVPLMEIINSYFIKYRTLALGLSLSGGTLSIFVLSPIFQWILEAYPWRYSYLGIAIFCATNLFVLPLLRPNPMPKLQPSISERVIDSTKDILTFASLRIHYDLNVEHLATSLKSPASTTQRSSLHKVFSSDHIRDEDTGAQRHNESLSTENAKNFTVLKSQFEKCRQSNEFEAIDSTNQKQDAKFEYSVIWDIIKIPAFHLIWFNQLLYIWLFSIWCLVIVDYGIDSGCTQKEAESLLSFQSMGELVGRLVLTLLVDMEFMTNRSLSILTMSILGGLLLLLTFVEGYIWLAAITVSYTALVGLLYILLNGLLIDYLGEDLVTIGFGLSSFISGILMTFRPHAVGYFRDNHGTYDPLLICLALFCAAGALLWFIEPLLTKVIKGYSKRNDIEDNNLEAIV